MSVCTACGSRKFTNSTIDGWVLYKCLGCGLIHTDLSSKKNIRNVNNYVYNESYIVSYKARKAELSSRFRKYLEIIEKYKRGGSILDIGCGLGFFIEIAKKSKVPWDAYGLELNEYLAREANTILKGKVKVGSLAHIPFNDNFFDCITCFDVLEHDVNVNKNLQNIHKALKDDGIVVIQSPNYRSLMQYVTGHLWDWWAIPDHVLHFSPDSLALALQRNKFKIRMLKTYEPLSDFVGNVKRLARQNNFTKALFVICLPALLVNRFFAHKIAYGGLVFAIAQKM